MSGGGVDVPQSDGVIGRTGEEGGRRQTGLRRVRQLWIHLRRNRKWFTSTHTRKYLQEVFLTVFEVLPAWTYLDAPHGAAVVQSRVQLPHVSHIFDVPHVHAVVVVHTGQVFGGGVKG